MAKKKDSSASWIDALNSAGKLQVKSARDALQVKGYLDTGNYALNWALSGKLLGGYPLGHCGEIFGDPSTGKSFLAARALAMAQKAGGVALLDDAEGAYIEERATKIGVDVDSLAYERSRTVKQHLAVTQSFLAAFRGFDAPLGLEVLDSIAQLSTEHEMETQLDKRDMTKAAELKAFYRIVGGDVFDLPIVHIGTNHTIANIGNPFQSRTTGGGGGPKFTASWRIDMRTPSKIKRGTEVVGVIVRAVVDKNRLVAPWKEVKLAIPFDQPISRASGLLPLLADLGILEARGDFLYKDGQKLGRTYKTRDKMLEQDNLGEELLDRFPELLEDADAAIAQGRTRTSTASVDSEEPIDGGEEED